MTTGLLFLAKQGGCIQTASSDRSLLYAMPW